MIISLRYDIPLIFVSPSSGEFGWVSSHIILECLFGRWKLRQENVSEQQGSRSKGVCGKKFLSRVVDARIPERNHREFSKEIAPILWASSFIRYANIPEPRIFEVDKASPTKPSGASPCRLFHSFVSSLFSSRRRTCAVSLSLSLAARPYRNARSPIIADERH